MPDPINPKVPVELTDEPQAEAMAPAEDRNALNKLTHEIDTNDMFSSST